MFYYQLSHFLAPRLLLRWYSPLTSTSSLFLLPLAHWYCPACSTRALYSTRPSSSSSSLSLSLSYSFLSLTALIYFLTSSYPSFPSTSSFSTTPSGLPLSLSLFFFFFFFSLLRCLATLLTSPPQAEPRLRGVCSSRALFFIKPDRFRTCLLPWDTQLWDTASRVQQLYKYTILYNTAHVHAVYVIHTYIHVLREREREQKQQQKQQQLRRFTVSAKASEAERRRTHRGRNTQQRYTRAGDFASA